jgi:hypothetical protein
VIYQFLLYYLLGWKVYDNLKSINSKYIVNCRPSYDTSLFQTSDKSNDPQLHLDRKGDDYSGGSVASGSSGFGSLPRKQRPSVLSSGDLGVLLHSFLSIACLFYYSNCLET